MECLIKSDKIYVANGAVDFRQGVNGLCGVVMEQFQQKPEEGIYVFYNRARNRLKIFGWHGNGFLWVYKRLEKGRFFIESRDEKIELNGDQLKWLLMGLDWKLLSHWETAQYQHCS